MYQQMRFDEFRELAEEVSEELGDSADPASRGRLLVAQAMGKLGTEGASPETLAQARQAIELAGASGDVRTELRARVALSAVNSEIGNNDPAAWQAIEEAATRLGDWPTAVSAAMSVIGGLLDDQGSTTFKAIEECRQLAQAHGLNDDVCWTHYFEAEAAFVSGDWERAIEAGLRAVELGEANAYLRATVRTLHVLIPIAAVRGDRSILEHGARWYASLEGNFVFPDSPYAQIVRPAQDLELAAAGLTQPYIPDVETRIASFQLEPGGPSWSSAVDRVFRAWLDAGELDGAEMALAAMTSARPGFMNPTSLGLGTYELLRGRLALARADSATAAEAGEGALERYRISAAPWWMAKAIRLLERAGAADQSLTAEAEEIEKGLGATGPTQ